MSGYRAIGVCPVVGARSSEKAFKTSSAILKR